MPPRLPRSLPVLAALLAGCASGGPPAPLPPLRAGPPAPGPAAEDPGDPFARRLASSLRWPDLLAGVLERAPSVRAARARWKAALERYPQAITLPDPMVRFEYYTAISMNPDG